MVKKIQNQIIVDDINAILDFPEEKAVTYKYEEAVPINAPIQTEKIVFDSTLEKKKKLLPHQEFIEKMKKLKEKEFGNNFYDLQFEDKDGKGSSHSDQPRLHRRKKKPFYDFVEVEYTKKNLIQDEVTKIKPKTNQNHLEKCPSFEEFPKESPYSLEKEHAKKQNFVFEEENTKKNPFIFEEDTSKKKPITFEKEPIKKIQMNFDEDGLKKKSALEEATKKRSSTVDEGTPRKKPNFSEDAKKKKQVGSREGTPRRKHSNFEEDFLKKDKFEFKLETSKSCHAIKKVENIKEKHSNVDEGSEKKTSSGVETNPTKLHFGVKDESSKKQKNPKHEEEKSKKPSTHGEVERSKKRFICAEEVKPKKKPILFEEFPPHFFRQNMNQLDHQNLFADDEDKTKKKSLFPEDEPTKISSKNIFLQPKNKTHYQSAESEDHFKFVRKRRIPFAEDECNDQDHHKNRVQMSKKTSEASQFSTEVFRNVELEMQQRPFVFDQKIDFNINLQAITLKSPNNDLKPRSKSLRSSQSGRDKFSPRNIRISSNLMSPVHY